MAEVALAAIVLVPLALLTHTALSLLRLGMSAGELTEAARQRLSGYGVLLLIAVIVMSFVTIGLGLAWFPRVLKLA